MKAIALELTRDVVSSYDSTKTTVLGRAAKKTLNALQGGKTVVGTPLNAFADVFTDSALTGNRITVSNNGHELHLTASSAAGLASLVLYDVDETTGLKSYVGKLQAQFPNTTHTWRGFRLVNDSGVTGWRIIISSIGTIAANGGLFSLENIAKTDFVQGVPAIIPAATAGGQKAVYWHQETGGTNNLTVAQGLAHAHDAMLGTETIVVPNGLVAAPSFYTFNAANTIVAVGGGGVTTDWYSHKTGTIAGLQGPFLLLNNYAIAVPDASSGAPLALQGQTCLFVAGSVGPSLGKISDLTSGATTWPSYTARDATDVSNTNTAVTPTTMHWSHTMQRVIMQLNNGSCIVKKFVNAAYEAQFGDANNSQYKAAQPVAFYEFGGIAFGATYEHNGWLYTTQSTAGQVVGQAFDMRSMYQYDFSSIISKVISVPRASFVSLSVHAPVRSFGKFWYRNSGFGSATGGWLEIPTDRILTTIANTTGQIQFKFQPRFDRDAVTIPLQIIESYLVIQPEDENDSAWRGDMRNSVPTSPARTAFSQVSTYTGTKHWEFKAYNRDTGALVAQADTLNNPTDFEISANDGVSYSAISGALASSPLLNVLRYKWSSPPAVPVDCSLREKV